MPPRIIDLFLMARQIYMDQSTTKANWVRKETNLLCLRSLRTQAYNTSRRVSLCIIFPVFATSACNLIWRDNTSQPRILMGAFHWKWKSVAECRTCHTCHTNAGSCVSGGDGCSQSTHTHFEFIYRAMFLPNFISMTCAASSAFEESCSNDLLVCNCTEGCCPHMAMQDFWFYFSRPY